MNNVLTERQISRIFNINPLTLRKLMREGKIPFTKNQDSRPSLFDIDAISRWVADNPLIESEEDVYLNKMRAEWRRKSPELFAALQAMDVKVAARSDAQKNPKRYSLAKRPNKKCGFLYYVRYVDNGKLVPSKWNTHTNILHDAEEFARANRARTADCMRFLGNIIKRDRLIWKRIKTVAAYLGKRHEAFIIALCMQ
ncbi:MAG: hypothetical protein LBK73_04265 [Treponema sp.]|nr:hypothetical protein [Treponema sp.]